jgi:hypothetical protein
MLMRIAAIQLFSGERLFCCGMAIALFTKIGTRRRRRLARRFDFGAKAGIIVALPDGCQLYFPRSIPTGATRKGNALMPNHSRYQQNIIKNYYQNRDDIMWQRLSELVTELYLAEGKKRKQLWKRAAAALEKMGVKPDRIDHLVTSDNPQLLAKFVEKKMD